MDSKNVEPFDAYGRYYDLFYQDKDYKAEVDYIDKLLQRHRISGKHLLEFGAGTGKHGRLLGDRGYQVIGVERSGEMVARSQKTSGFENFQGDMRTVHLNRTFNAVLSLFHVLSYQITNSDVRAVFARAKEHLCPGGLFIFDFWYTPAVHFQQPAVRIKRMADEGTEITRLAEPVIYPNENRVDVNYTVIARDVASMECQTFAEVHPMRHFSLPELDLFGEMTGFERIGAEEFLTGAAPGPSTWGVCLILRRTDR